MKKRFYLLFSALAVNIASVALHSRALLALSIVMFAGYYAIKFWPKTPMNTPPSEIEQRKVCPSCGYMPWDFANPGPNNENQPAFCQDCGDKLIPQSELPRDIWKDPYVKEALKDGRQPFDIYVMRCPKCNQLGYYNEGSSFSCRFGCGGWRVTDEMATDSVTLADTVTETTDDYHNHTL